MTNRKTTRRALVLSLLSLLLCCSMLVGTTFAWFTDSVTSGNNKIVAGNLDIELYHSNKTVSDEKVSESTKLFDEITLWEPGVVAYENLTVANVGTLALKYKLSVNFNNATATPEGKTLADVLKVAFVEGGLKSTTREGAIAEGAAAGWGEMKSFAEISELKPGQTTEETFGIVIYWEPGENDNDYNMNNGKQGTTLSIDLGVNLLATQVEAELDSFGNDYDKNAWTEVAEPAVPDENGAVDVYTAEQLAGVMANTTGIKTINIMADINLYGRTWAPAYVSAPDLVINGNGHTISNMTTNGKEYQGFIGVAYQNITINDLTFKNAVVKANKSFDGCVIGWAWSHADVTFNNVDVVDSEISATLGNKCIRVGGLIGFFPYDGGNLTLKDCDVTGSTITGYHNVGAMVGTTLTQKTVAVENCTAKNNTLKYGSPNVGAFDFGAFDSGYNAYVPATGFTAENNKLIAVAIDANALIAALESGKPYIMLGGDIKIEPASLSNAYGTTGINLKAGQTLDGAGHTLNIQGATGTWDSGICTAGGTIKNITVTGSFRGIFIKNNAEKVVLENVTTVGTTYTISCDQGDNGGILATGCTFYGWTSFAKTAGNAKFVDCTFAEGSGNAYCRPYAPTEFVGCEFQAGYQLDARGAVTFENCTLGGAAVTAENMATLVTGNTANATVK